MTPTGHSTLRVHANALNAHLFVASTAPTAELLAKFDIPQRLFEAYKAARTTSPSDDDAQVITEITATLDALNREIELVADPSASDADRRLDQITVADAIGWLCALWGPEPASGRPRGQTEAGTIRAYGARPGAWVYYAAGMSPAEVEQTLPADAFTLAMLRGAHLPALTT